MDPSRSWLVSKNATRWRDATGRASSSPGCDSRETLLRAHPVVLRLRRDLGEAERFEQRRHVHAEAAAQPLLQPIPAFDRILRRPPPRLDRSLRSWLLLVGAAKRHPISVLLEHRPQIVDRPQLVPELRLPYDAHERRRIGVLGLVHDVLGPSARSLQLPGLLFGAYARHLRCHRLSPPPMQWEKASRSWSVRRQEPRF